MHQGDATQSGRVRSGTSQLTLALWVFHHAFESRLSFFLSNAVLLCLVALVCGPLYGVVGLAVAAGAATARSRR
ncbi:hypothetical protein [Streptomyces sp. NPDC057686]|uniref:hypothetical protein n=1 Tax=Streptomyces sp. NPDC057686 TaxID=3346212 RepID=UPI0036874421